MVTVKKKGCCGDKRINYYYCDWCGVPYDTMGQARSCEIVHKMEMRRKLNKKKVK